MWICKLNVLRLNDSIFFNCFDNYWKNNCFDTILIAPNAIMGKCFANLFCNLHISPVPIFYSLFQVILSLFSFGIVTSTDKTCFTGMPRVLYSRWQVYAIWEDLYIFYKAILEHTFNTIIILTFWGVTLINLHVNSNISFLLADDVLPYNLSVQFCYRFLLGHQQSYFYLHNLHLLFLPDV